jgi:hypothetical protein
MLSKEKIMEVLEAYDLTGSYRSAAQLCGVDHHTVRRYVKAREAGLDVTVRAAPARETVVDPFIDHVEGWVDRSKGTIRGNVVHEKLEALGYDGSERTTRRVVKRVKAVWRHKNHRSYRPWIPEPGLWFLCGTPHRNQYVAPAVMWSGPSGLLAGGGERLEGVHIVTGIRGTRGAGPGAGSGRRVCSVGWCGRELVLSGGGRRGGRSGWCVCLRGRARGR